MVTLNAEQPGQAQLRTRSRESSVRGQVYRLLLRDIERCVSKPGQPLSEKEVAAALGVSRTPVREAFLQLSEDGLVVIAPQRGTAVAKISSRQVRQAQFTREVLERAILAVDCGFAGAGESGNSGVPAGLQAALYTQRSAVARQDYTAFYEADREFHAGLARLSGFDGAGRLAGGARIHLNRVRWLGLPEPRSLEAALAEHEAIAAAVAAGDARRGDAVLTAHLRTVLGTLPAIRERFPGYFDDDDNDGQSVLPDTTGLTVGWNEVNSEDQ
jgi:DNA-binding GntR family transcriptional regulator